MHRCGSRAARAELRYARLHGRLRPVDWAGCGRWQLGTGLAAEETRWPPQASTAPPLSTRHPRSAYSISLSLLCLPSPASACISLVLSRSVCFLCLPHPLSPVLFRLPHPPICSPCFSASFERRYCVSVDSAGGSACSRQLTHGRWVPQVDGGIAIRRRSRVSQARSPSRRPSSW